jgi:type IV pilus assembly protein PilQ
MRNNRETQMVCNWRSYALALALLIGVPFSAVAENAIQSVNSTQQAGAEVIRIELSEPLTAVPAGFTIQTPPRIAIDLPGVGNAMGRSSVEINQGNLRSVSVAQSGERTRLVLNLKQASNYRAQLQGKVLLVVLDSAAPPAATATPGEPVRYAESLNRNQLPLKEIDFRRGADGAGRVIVDLPNNQVGVDIRQQGQSLVVEFLRSTLPEALRRRLDVTDFGTPVQSVTTTQSGDKVRMVVEPRGAWEPAPFPRISSQTPAKWRVKKGLY